MPIQRYDSEIEKYMQSSLDSTERSRRRIEDSGALGAATVQELHVQRENFVNMEQNLDGVYRTTQVAQQNLNSLKSFFGGVFQRRRSSSSRIPSLPYQKETSSETFPQAPISTETLKPSTCSAIKGTRWETMDHQIHDNLDAMSADLHGLKRIAMDIGREVESQNQMLDRISQKTELNNIVIKDQVQQMENMLGTPGSSGKMTLMKRTMAFFK